VIAIAMLTLREAVRRRLLWALVLFTVVLVVLTAWGFGQVESASPLPGIETAIGVSQLLILLAFMFSFVLAMTAVFLGAPAVASLVESGEALALLARPLRRADLVLGRWLGFAAIVVAYATVAGLLEVAAAALATGYAPPHPLEASLYIAAEGLVLLTFAVLLSTRLGVITGGAVAVVLFGIAWIVGVMGQVGVAFSNDGLRIAGDVSRLVLPTDILWRGAIASLEPPIAMLALGGSAGRIFEVSPFYASEPPGLLALAAVAAWVVGALGIAVGLFAGREL
jgi:ABC-type transport system involved in multi-copper enzyme maturation permease subunit